MDMLTYDAVPDWQLTLYKNTAAGFSKQPFPTVRNSSGYTSNFWGDENGDGLLDVLVAGADETSRPISEFLRQNADHTFAQVQPALKGRPTAWVDLDNNGSLDVVAVPLYHNGLLIYWREADGSYTATTNFVSDYFQEAGSADLDSDGDMDLILNVGNGRRVFRNDGFRRFTDTGATLKSGVLRDLNADGLLDAVYSIEVNPVVTSYVQFNRGSFGFEEVTLPLKLLHRISSVADFNGHSLPDFFMHSYPRASGSDYRPVIYLNIDGTNFQHSGVVFPYVMEVKGSELADFDNDGDIDVLAYGDDVSGENRRRFFRNNGSVQVVVPTPTNLNAAVRFGAVQLSWEAFVP